MFGIPLHAHYLIYSYTMAYLGLVFYGKLKQTQIKTMYHVIVKIYKLNTYKIHMDVHPYVCVSIWVCIHMCVFVKVLLALNLPTMVL